MTACDMGCQPDWHHAECAIYLPAAHAPQVSESENDRSAKAWVQGFLFGYYMDRGYTNDEALKAAQEPVPAHLSCTPDDWLSGENPYTDDPRVEW